MVCEPQFVIFVRLYHGPRGQSTVHVYTRSNSEHVEVQNSTHTWHVATRVHVHDCMCALGYRLKRRTLSLAPRSRVIAYSSMLNFVRGVFPFSLRRVRNARCRVQLRSVGPIEDLTRVESRILLALSRFALCAIFCLLTVRSR